MIRRLASAERSDLSTLRTSWIAALLAAFLIAVEGRADDPKPASSLQLKHCLVTAIDDVQVSAPRTAILQKVLVQEGAYLKPDELVAQLDDAEAQIQLRAADAEYKAAAGRAKSDLHIRHADATHLVAKAEHEMHVKINERNADAVSPLELERLRLTADLTSLKVELAKLERETLRTEIGITQAKADLARHDVDRRRIRTPLGGEVAEIFVRNGEWVEAGKPVLRIIRLDRLRVEGFVRVRDAFPGEIVGRPVTVRSELARGQWREFTGRITFVSPLVQAGGDYRIWAEVENRREQDQWLLRPGLEAEMQLLER